MSSKSKKGLTHVEELAEESDHQVRRFVKGLWIVGILVAFLLFLYGLVPFGEEGDLWYMFLIFCLGLLLFTVIMGYLVLRQDLGDSSRDRWLRLVASMIALIASLIFFALSYRLLANSSPGEFSGLTTFVDAIYFTLATTLTVGFGDVYAAGQIARIMVICQMLFTVVVLAATGRSIVGIFQVQARKRRTSNT